MRIGNLLWAADKGPHLILVILGVLYTMATLNIQWLSVADQQNYMDRINVYVKLWRLLAGLHLRMLFVHQSAQYAQNGANNK